MSDETDVYLFNDAVWYTHNLCNDSAKRDILGCEDMAAGPMTP